MLWGLYTSFLVGIQTPAGAMSKTLTGDYSGVGTAEKYSGLFFASWEKSRFAVSKQRSLIEKFAKYLLFSLVLENLEHSSQLENYEILLNQSIGLMSECQP